MVVENAQQQRSVGSIVFRQQSVERSSFDSRARVSNSSPKKSERNRPGLNRDGQR